MNWLFMIEVCFSGLIAGVFAWLVSPAGNPWDMFGNFQTSLLSTGIFSGLFIGLVSALPVLLMEKRLVKAAGYWISATSVGLAINMLAAVVFTIFGEVILDRIIISEGLIRFFWWIFMSVSLSICFGILHHSVKIGCRALMGLTPGFLIAGTLVDKFFLIEHRWLMSYLFIGGVVGSCFAIVWDLLKESWLDEDPGGWFIFRYYIDCPEFIAGGVNECDLSIDGASDNIFAIVEKDGLHSLEVLDDKQVIRINNCHFRYRVLTDGDIIAVEGRCFVYHSKLARSRDILPEAAA
ncbi:MAG: hypothetical protein PWR01_3931 [Clostridiales bacterium]|nr:hypothetical protein [Clostridiales bacterium]MDN5282858.1 hypothetical protein [Candidatus Ozemobacter sp.]